MKKKICDALSVIETINSKLKDKENENGNLQVTCDMCKNKIETMKQKYEDEIKNQNIKMQEIEENEKHLKNLYAKALDELKKVKEEANNNKQEKPPRKKFQEYLEQNLMQSPPAYKPPLTIEQQNKRLRE